MGSETGLEHSLLLPEGENVEVRADDGCRLSAWRGGTSQGPTVLLVPGVTLSGKYWAAVARLLVDRGFDVLCIDQRGHAQSDRGTDPFTSKTLAEDLDCWINELGLDDVVLVGHSMGSIPVVQAGIRASSFGRSPVRAIVVMGTGPPRPQRSLLLFGKLTSVLTHPRVPGRRRFASVLMRPFGGPRIPADVRSSLIADFLEFDRGVFAENNRMVGELDLADDLKIISIPTVLLAGSADRVTPPSAHKELAKLIPGATVTVLEGCGHMAMFEAPDTIADHITRAARDAR